jgi:hypothetical protein
MGWSFGWNSRTELADYLTETRRTNLDDGSVRTFQTLKRRWTGNNLWCIQQNVVEKDGQVTNSDKFIVLYMMQTDKKHGWGYKDVSASMGPTYYNCPVSWFDEVPEDGQYDTEWREACREAAAKAKAITKLADGEQVYLPYELKFTDGVLESAFTVCKDGKRTLFRRAKDGVRIRMSKGQQAHLKRPEAPAMPELEEAFAQ